MTHDFTIGFVHFREVGVQLENFLLRSLRVLLDILLFFIKLVDKFVILICIQVHAGALLAHAWSLSLYRLQTQTLVRVHLCTMGSTFILDQLLQL